MARSYQITVEYDPTSGSLKIDPASRSDLTLAPDTSPIHALRWSFQGVDGLVAAGWVPTIRFEHSPDKSVPEYSGPFINLTRTTSSVIASGIRGETGTYRYRAMLEPPIASKLPAIRSSGARLFSQVTEPTPAVIKVWRSAEDSKLLLVEPEAVTCATGQTVLWKVIESEEEVRQWYPRLVFADGPAGTSSHFGPFTSLDTRGDGILASGSAGHPGQYNYAFQMVSVEDGEVLFESSDDPTVDDQGDPPNVGGDD
ncbi:MAG: hypothetical protein AAF657_26000 [Acidobacteriota bacterium]